MTPIPTLSTERLWLKPPTSEAFEAHAAFYASERSRFVAGPLSRGQAWRGYAAEAGHWLLRGFGRWAVQEKASGAWCGLVGCWGPEDWPEPEIGWSLYAGAEGRGIAFEAASAARDYAYQTLGWRTAISLIDPANDRSRLLAERMGAGLDGTFEHERFGLMQIWRHPSPKERAA